MTFFENLFKKGELPTVNTEVSIENKSIAIIAIVVVLVATAIILINKAAKR